MASPAYAAVTCSEPRTLGENPTEHMPLLLNVQLPDANVPPLLGDTLQVTVPDGVPTVPTGLVSVTVAVQVVATPTSVGFGVQATVVPERRWTVRLVVPLLGRCLASPA
jgi:hypothetical protein